MAGRDRFLDAIGLNRSFTIPGDATASQIYTLLSNVRITVYKLDSAGTREGSPSVIYSSRAGAAKSNPFTTTTNGSVDFFADPGEYEIDVHDLTVPARITDYVINWSSVPGGTSGLSIIQLPSSGGGLSVPGDIKIQAMTAVAAADPNGWLWCDGRIMSRTTYAALFAVIGTAFNGGGETGAQFRIPDLRGRAPVGADSMDTAAGSANRLTANDIIGQSGGAEKHTLITAEIPAHAHTATILNASNMLSIPDGSGVPVVDINATISTDNAGGGGAHNNMQPYQAVSFLIKT